MDAQFLNSADRLKAALILEVNGFLNIDQVCAITTLSSKYIRDLRDKGAFPQPERIVCAERDKPVARQRVGWRAWDVLAWLMLREEWTPETAKNWIMVNKSYVTAKEVSLNAQTSQPGQVVMVEA